MKSLGLVSIEHQMPQGDATQDDSRRPCVDVSAFWNQVGYYVLLNGYWPG